MVFTSSELRVDTPVPLDMTMTTMPHKYSIVHFIRFKYHPLECTMIQVTILYVPGHMLLIASLMLSWALEHGTPLSFSASFFVRRSVHESSSTLNSRWPNNSSKKAP